MSLTFCSPFSDIAVWTVLEPSVGIIAGCIATLRPLFKRWGFGPRSTAKESDPAGPSLSFKCRSNDSKEGRGALLGRGRRREDMYGKIDDELLDTTMTTLGRRSNDQRAASSHEMQESPAAAPGYQGSLGGGGGDDGRGVANSSPTSPAYGVGVAIGGEDSGPLGKEGYQSYQERRTARESRSSFRQGHVTRPPPAAVRRDPGDMV